jgi:AraC-like DNA-binding protein
MRLARCPFHHHTAIEIVYHREGVGTTALESGEKIPFEPGSVVVYPSGMVHNQNLAEPGGVDVVVQVSAASRESELNASECLYVPPLRDPVLVDLLESLAAAGVHIDQSERVGLSLDASRLMHGLLRLEITRKRTLSQLSPMELAAHEARTIIKNHYRAIDHLPEVAQRLGVGYDALRREFKRVHGVTMKQWLARVRIDQACALLRNSSLAQVVIAELSGFTDAQHFCADFRRRTGMTPGEYRQREARR